MRLLLLLLLILLRLEDAIGLLDNCPCSPIPASPSACPFYRECDASRVRDANCTLTCGDGFQLMYRTGIPWRSTSFLRCHDGRHQPATGSALAASVAAVACAAAAKCTNCVPPKADAYCPPDYVCRGDVIKVVETADGCGVVSCTWGELMVIDTVQSTTVSPATVPSATVPSATVPPATVTSQAPTVLPTPGRPAVPNRILQPFSPQVSIMQPTVPHSEPTVGQGSPMNVALPEGVLSGNQANHFSETDSLPGPAKGTGSILAKPGSSTGSGAGFNLPKAGSGSGSGSTSQDLIPKKEEEYYDDSELASVTPERSTMSTHGVMATTTTLSVPTTTSPTTMTTNSENMKPEKTTATTAQGVTAAPQVDLFGRPILSRHRTTDFTDPFSLRMNSQLRGLKKPNTDDDYEDDFGSLFRARRNFHQDRRRMPSSSFLSPSPSASGGSSIRELLLSSGRAHGGSSPLSHFPSMASATLLDGSSQERRSSLSLAAASQKGTRKSSTSFLARVRKGAFSFISRQARRLERHIFGFAEEASTHSITVDRKTGAEKLVNRVIGGTSPSSPFARWDDFEADDSQIRAFTQTTTTGKPVDAGRIMGSVPAPQPARQPSNWLADILETTTVIAPRAPSRSGKESSETVAQFSGGIGADWNEVDQMVVRDNVKRPVHLMPATTAFIPTATTSSPSSMTTSAAAVAVAETTHTTAASRQQAITTNAASSSSPPESAAASPLSTTTTSHPAAEAAASATRATGAGADHQSVPIAPAAAASPETTPAATAAVVPSADAATMQQASIPLQAASSSSLLHGGAAPEPVVPQAISVINVPPSAATIAAASPTIATTGLAAAATTTSLAGLPVSQSATSDTSQKTSAAAAMPRRVVEEGPRISLPDESHIDEIGLMAVPKTGNRMETTETPRRVVEEGPRISLPDESHIDEIGLMAVPTTGHIEVGMEGGRLSSNIAEMALGARGNGPQEGINTPLQAESMKEMGGKEQQALNGGDGKEGQMTRESALVDGKGAETGKELPLIASVPHTVDFDSTSPRLPWGKVPVSDGVIPQTAADAAAPAATALATPAATAASAPIAAAARIAPLPATEKAAAPHQPPLAFTRAGSLTCSGNGLWHDANFALRQSARVTCARKKSCGTCAAPPLLQQCDERHDCGGARIISVEAENGCVKGVCEDGESFIAVRDPATGKAIADLSEMSCDPFGRWRSSMFDVIGESIEAVCYRPKCKKCSLQELACPSERHCDMSLMAEPEPNQRCFSLRCGEGARMLVRDDTGAVRTATKIDCSHNVSWVLTEAGTGAEIAVTGPEAAVTCEYNPPPCQMCPRLSASSECPGAAHRPCFPLTQKGGVAEKSCRINTCEPGDELWVKLPSGWSHPDKLSMLGCAGDQGWIGNDGVTKLPPDAQAICKRAACDNCVAPTVSAFCPEEHGEKGCDSFAMRRNGTRYDEKTGCTSIICPNEGKIAFHNPATGSFVTTTKQMHCVNGQWLTDLGEPVPPTLHVTCADWTGNRSVCGNGGCTYSLEDPRAKMRFSEAGGCYELYCETGNILGFNPRYSSWEPANQGHFTCSDKGWKRAYGVPISDLTDYRFHIRMIRLELTLLLSLLCLCLAVHACLRMREVRSIPILCSFKGGCGDIPEPDCVLPTLVNGNVLKCPDGKMMYSFDDKLCAAGCKHDEATCVIDTYVYDFQGTRSSEIDADEELSCR